MAMWLFSKDLRLVCLHWVVWRYLEDFAQLTVDQGTKSPLKVTYRDSEVVIVPRRISTQLMTFL